MGIRLIFICVILVTVLSHKCVGGGNLTTAACSEQERLALLKFKQSVRDDNGMLSSWGVGDDCCSWERVGCDDSTGRVVSLHLSRSIVAEDLVDQKSYWRVNYYDPTDCHLISDEVNSCLTELVNLKHLDLSGNYFQDSQIPEFFGSFKQLRYLNLSNAGFEGNIPHQIGNLSNLKVLDLSDLYIIGSIPHEIGNLSNLKVLNLGSPGSQVLTTSDMTWVSGLSKLEHLDLSGVNLSRTQNLENLLYTLPTLSKLSLSNCELSMAHLGSRLLNSSRKLPTIKHMDLSGNYFIGQLPTLFLNVTTLAILDLSLNDLSMAWIFENLLSMMPFVSELRLSGCRLQNINLPSTHLNFSKNSNIQHLDISLNEIEGRFPYVLTNMSSLSSLDLSNNMLNSSIPVMPNLLRLDISYNEFRHIKDVGIWRQCHLKELTVSNNHLEGELISPSANVSECPQSALEILDLDCNTLNGSIPESIGRLANLRRLDLSNNQMTGPIPEAIGNLTTLTELLLKENRFIGPIPVSLGRLTSLRVLSVSSNLLCGTIPNSMGQLAKLYLLDISNNSLQGVVSENHFANLSMLKYVDANSNNNLFFNISREWMPPFQLKVTRLGSCKIEDGFPQWLRSQRKLEELVLSNASITGPLPKWLRFLPIIRILDLSHNKLTGPLTNLCSVYEVRYEFGGQLLLQNNLFKGLIPRWLCTRTDLRFLDLSKNRLFGKIPKCLWNMSLKAMVLSSNRLSGVITLPLCLNPPLKLLQLNDNNLSGEIPRDLMYFTSLQVLDLGENKISGNIPEWIGENVTLLALRLHKNNFTGTIPDSLCNCFHLQILDLAHNNLTGFIPHCFGELNAMTENPLSYPLYWVRYSYGNMMQILKGVALDYTKTLQFVRNMDLSGNKLVGEIPETLTTLDGLVGFNLSHNRLSGSIPRNIGNMKLLNSLDLSANELTGMIPPSLGALNFLSYLNLSHNNLSGQIPRGNQLQTLTDLSIYADNPYLCGAPLPKECFPHEKPPTTTSKNKDGHANEPKKIWFYLDIMSGFATGFWGIIGVLVFKKQWRRKLFMFCEETMDKIYVAVAVRVLKMKRGREAA